MGLFLAVLLLGPVLSTQESAGAKPPAAPASGAESLPGNLLALPRGKVTVIGGTIDRVDPVNDQFLLRVFGAKPIKVLYDERTQVYRDGVKAALTDLHANQHASVETMLDGTTVFARSVHMLSKAPEGEAQGQISGFDTGTREMTLSEALSGESIKLRVPADISVVRQGQAVKAPGSASPSDLVKGALISAQFTSDNKGQGVARRIAILALPGTQLTFAGSVAYLNLKAKEFVVRDVENDQSYKISFDPGAFPESKELHEGTKVKVTADFDGTHYVARAISIAP